MNDFKHLAYECRGCEDQSMWVWSLNNSTMITFVPQLRHQRVGSMQIWSIKYGSIGMMVDPSVNPLHVINDKHLAHVCSRYGDHSMLVWSLNKSIMITFIPMLRHSTIQDFTKLVQQQVW